MLTYNLRVAITNDKCEMHELGFLLPRVLFEEKFRNDNPLIAREEAFSKLESYKDILISASKGGTENFQGIDDAWAFINSNLNNEQGEFSAVEIDLWMDIDGEDNSLPYTNRVIDSNRDNIGCLGNLDKEVKAYRKFGYETGDTRELIYLEMKFEVIALTPELEKYSYNSSILGGKLNLY